MAYKLISSVYGKIEKVLIILKDIYSVSEDEKYEGIKQVFAGEGRICEVRMERPGFQVAGQSERSGETTYRSMGPSQDRNRDLLRLRLNVKAATFELMFNKPFDENIYRSVVDITRGFDIHQIASNWKQDIDDIFMAGAAHITHKQWAQDPLIVLQSPLIEARLLLQPLYTHNFSTFVLPIQVAASRGHGLKFYTSPVPLCLEGGNILCLDQEAFIGMDLLVKNISIRVEHELYKLALALYDNPDLAPKEEEEKIPEPREGYRDGGGLDWADLYSSNEDHLPKYLSKDKLKTLIGKEGLVEKVDLEIRKELKEVLGLRLGDIHYIGYSKALSTYDKSDEENHQPHFHLDLFLTLSGQQRNEKEIIFIGCPELARQIIENEQAGTSGLMSPYTSYDWDQLVKCLEAVHAQFKTDPKLSQYELVRIPMALYGEIVYSWNNSIVEVYDDCRHIYVPTYYCDEDDKRGKPQFNPEIKILEKEVAKTYSDYGFTVIPIGSGCFMREAASNMGSLNCLTKVLSRSSFQP